jgi:hypothetical protein
VSKTLTCAICGRRQVVGFLSMQSWASAESSSTELLACPDCQADHADWRDQLERLAGESK